MEASLTALEIHQVVLSFRFSVQNKDLLMPLFNWLFKRPEPKAEEIASVSEYPNETKEVVRKWLNRFDQDVDFQKDFWDAVGEYKLKNGFEPKVNDIIWGLLNEKRTLYFKQGNMGLYRNATHGMCKLLEVEDKQHELLTHIIQFITLGACGARNVGWEEAFGGPFSLEEAFIPPISAPMLVECAQRQGLSVDSLREKFIELSGKQLDQLGRYCPAISALEIWSLVEADVKRLSLEPLKKSRRRVGEPSLSEA